MPADEGRDYKLEWPAACADGGEHDVLLDETLCSYLPTWAVCSRCKARAEVCALPLQV